MQLGDFNQVLDACRTFFESEGFHVPARGRIYYPMGDFLGWVGLNRSSSSASIEVRPFVGVHHVPVMELVAKLLGRKYVKGDVATYAMALGVLVPQQASFNFRAGADHSAEARRLVDAVVQHALPWMRKIGSLNELIALLRERESMLGGVPERIAAALYLQGKNYEVSEYVKQRQKEYDQDSVNPELAKSWRKFSAALLEMDRVKPLAN